MDLATCVLRLGNTGLEVLIEATNLVKDLSATGLAGLLLRANAGELAAEFLLALGGRRVLVRGAGIIDLGLDLFLFHVSVLT